MVAYAIGVAGLLVLVAGTFLPWLQSGQVRRNSYASFGVLDRLIGFHGVTEAAIKVWPLLGLCCAAVVTAAVVRWHGTAAVLGLLMAGWSAAVAIAVLLRDTSAGVQVVAVGPLVTFVGDIAVAAAATLTLVQQVRNHSLRREP